MAEGNDHGDLSEEEVEEARREIMILQHAFACEAIRTDWIIAPSLKALRCIADKTTGALVGKLALKAIEAIWSAF